VGVDQMAPTHFPSNGKITQLQEVLLSSGPGHGVDLDVENATRLPQQGTAPLAVMDVATTAHLLRLWLQTSVLSKEMSNGVHL